MSGRDRKVSTKMLFISLMISGVILLLTPSSITDAFQLAFTNIFSLPLSFARNITLSAQTGLSKSRLSKEREYNKLQNHIANLQAQLNEEREKVEKLTNLRSRFGLEGADFVYADIITSSLTGSRNEMMINRGTTDGIRIGQFVLAVNNVIGKITAVSEQTSKIKLITDSSSRIPVTTAGQDTILKGLGDNAAEIDLLPTKVDIGVGDSVYIRKQPGYLDSSMITGRVSDISKNRQHPLLWDITVEPACVMENLSSVVVIVKNPKIEQEE
jgi:rod shape-determining protein MreC